MNLNYLNSLFDISKVYDTGLQRINGINGISSPHQPTFYYILLMEGRYHEAILVFTVLRYKRNKSQPIKLTYSSFQLQVPTWFSQAKSVNG